MNTFELMADPNYPATCDNCGKEGTNASMEHHVCQTESKIDYSDLYDAYHNLTLTDGGPQVYNHAGALGTPLSHHDEKQSKFQCQECGTIVIAPHGWEPDNCPSCHKAEFLEDVTNEILNSAR